MNMKISRKAHPRFFKGLAKIYFARKYIKYYASVGSLIEI
jgi:hypothetical protein